VKYLIEVLVSLYYGIGKSIGKETFYVLDQKSCKERIAKSRINGHQISESFPCEAIAD
jgi:hypothetical protein